MTKFYKAASCGWLLSCAILASAAEPQNPANSEAFSRPDKSSYNLFNPTPNALMREMNTDRPDKTESPYTVDAGHFQLEMDLVSYTYDHNGSERSSSYAIAPVNLKLGLLNDFDLQVILPTWNTVRTEELGRVVRQSGFGDVMTRFKYNFWGNDSGKTAFGVMPFVKYPTSQDGLGNNAVEAGIILPVSVELPLGFGLGAMSELDFNRNEANHGRHVEIIHSVTVSREIIGNLEGYVEFFSLVNTEHGAGFIATFDAGLGYALNKNWRLDTGVNIGLTRAADDVNPFVGLSFRF